MPFLEKQFLYNSMTTWILSVVILIVVAILLRWLKKFIQNRLSSSKRTDNNSTGKFFAELLQRTGSLFILALAVYAGSLMLTLPSQIHTFLRSGMIIVVLLQVAFWGTSLIDYLISRRLEGDESDPAAEVTSLNALKLVAKIVMWTLVVLLILENLTGIKIDALIASLGITGVAVALAVQNILGDLFSSLSIALDKPFVIGDLINIDTFTGTVEHIGLKSTRVRSIDGEEVIFSNSDLLNSRIRNFKNLERRRVVLPLGVVYQTPVEKLEMIPAMIKDILKDLEGVTLDRAHLAGFGDFSINFEVAYFVESPEFLLHMDLQQAINLELYRRFSQENIEFAYPTQTVILDKTS